MSSKKGKKRRIASSDDDDQDVKPEREPSVRTDAPSAAAAVISSADAGTDAPVNAVAVPAAPAAAAAAAAAAEEFAPAAADDKEKSVKHEKPEPAAGVVSTADEKAKAALKHAKETAYAKMGALFHAYDEQKIALSVFKNQETAELKKMEHERKLLTLKGDALRQKCVQYEDLLQYIKEAVASDDPVQIKRAVETDPTAVRPSATRKLFQAPPMSPQRPPAAAAAAAAANSPAKLPVKFRNAPPDAKQSTLEYIRRNGAWFVTNKRQPDPTRPCRACGALEHWTTDATVNPETPDEGEWACPKVRQWALPPVRPAAIEVE